MIKPVTEKNWHHRKWEIRKCTEALVACQVIRMCDVLRHGSAFSFCLSVSFCTSASDWSAQGAAGFCSRSSGHVCLCGSWVDSGCSPVPFSHFDRQQTTFGKVLHWQEIKHCRAFLWKATCEVRKKKQCSELILFNYSNVLWSLRHIKHNICMKTYTLCPVIKRLFDIWTDDLFWQVKSYIKLWGVQYGRNTLQVFIL